MSSETLLDIKCKCGGRLKSGITEVEFFGIEFGLKEADICVECGSEYLSQDLMEEIEAEVKRRGLFGLERRARLVASGNSLAIRIPKEMAQSPKLKATCHTDDPHLSKESEVHTGWI